MREIKFRGKSIDNEWYIGNYIYFGGSYILCPTEMFSSKLGQFKCDKNSIGQFTGLKDIDGKEIYEGDFLKEITHPCSDLPGHVAEQDDLYNHWEIMWDERVNGWNAFPISSLSVEDFDIAIEQLGGLITWPSQNVLQNNHHYRIIGNKYDNPELCRK